MSAVFTERPAPLLAGEASTERPQLRLDVQEWSRSPGDTTAEERATPLSVLFGRRPDIKPVSDQFHLDVTPLFDDFVSVVRDAGIPVHAVQDASGERRIGVSASFNLGERLPALSFHAGQSMPELYGAFSTARSTSWALVWPAQQFTLRVEGGNHSEFGYFAIAAAQWSDPSRPLAFGIGIPMHLHNAKGGTGVLMQFRCKFH